MKKGRQHPAARETLVDSSLDLRVSAQPGPVFVQGGGFKIPSEAVSGLRHTLTRLISTSQWPQVVALTAALRGEGVSYSAMAISAILNHDTGQPVCLVDANWYWPSVPILNTPGLAGVLAQTTPLGQALVRVNEGNLHFLPAGQMPAHRRTTAAHSAELKAAVATLRQHYSYVVLDLPSILATSDTIALAALADAFCLVVRQGATPAATAREALRAIEHLPTLGVIVNRVRLSMPAGLAGHLTQGWAHT